MKSLQSGLMKLRTECIDIVLLVKYKLRAFFCLKLVIDNSLCTIYKYVVMLFYIFFLGGDGSRKKRYVTNRGLSNQALQAVTWGIGGQNARFFCYVLLERSQNYTFYVGNMNRFQPVFP